MFYNIVDLEATCDDANDRCKHEIIEIGVTGFSDLVLCSELTFQTFVKPERYPILSDFCKNLTSISQEQVNAGDSFEVALAKYVLWLDFAEEHVFYEPPVLCSWGNWDKKQIIIECLEHNVSYPFDIQHINLKAEICKFLNIKPMGLSSVLNYVGIEFCGIPHRAISDSMSTAKLTQFCLNKGMKPNVTRE